MRIKFGRALIALGLILGGMAIAAPASAQENIQSECYKEVTQYKTVYEYQKHVKGVIQYDIDPRGGHEYWVTIGAFDYEPYDLTQWSDNASLSDEGEISFVLSAWSEGDWVKVAYRKLVTHYKYIPTGKTDEVENGTEQVPVDCPVYPVKCESINGPIYVSNLDAKNWNTDSAHFVEGGIKIWVDGDWDSNYISKPFYGTLADLGTNMDFVASPSQYVGIHIVTDLGTIVYEQEPSYAGNYWSTEDFGVGAGMGYASFAPFEDFVLANPDLNVKEIRVLYTHPSESFTIIESVTFACTQYVFDFEEESEEEPPATTVPPTTQPPVTTPPTTVPTDTVPTDTVPVDVSSNTQTNTDPQTEVLSENVEAEELAFTGSNSKPMAALGAILLAAGLGLAAFDRKRKNIA